MTLKTEHPDSNCQPSAVFQSAVVIDALGGSTIRRPSPVVDGKDRIDQLLDGGLSVVNETIANPGDGLREAMLDIFGRIPGTQNPPSISVDQYERLWRLTTPPFASRAST